MNTTSSVLWLCVGYHISHCLFSLISLQCVISSLDKILHIFFSKHIFRFMPSNSQKKKNCCSRSSNTTLNPSSCYQHALSLWIHKNSENTCCFISFYFVIHKSSNSLLLLSVSSSGKRAVSPSVTLASVSLSLNLALPHSGVPPLSFSCCMLLLFLIFFFTSPYLTHNLCRISFVCKWFENL